MESLIRETTLDKAARQIGIDPVELRRKNLIYLPDQPVTSNMGIEVTDITPGECLEKLIANADIAGFRTEQAQAQIGRASRRERVCQDVQLSVVAVSFNNNNRSTELV